MSDAKDKLYELCVECQRRVGSLILAMLLLSTLYWLSFFLFLEDPRHGLIGPARSFVSKIDALEQDHLGWRTLKNAEISRLVLIGDRYLAGLERLPATDPARTRHINLDVQIRLPDRVLTDFINRTQADNYLELTQRWLSELKDLSLNKIVYTSEVLDLYKAYDALNLPPGWLSETGTALGFKARPVPADLDTLPWQELRGRLNVLFATQTEFERTTEELQTLWQGEITDEMQARALRGTGVWLRNLESGRSIANGFVRKEPNIRLPFLGENVSGRWAFYLGPFAILILLRYLLVLAQHIRALEADLSLVRLEGHEDVILSEDETLGRFARYPNLIEVLRTAPDSSSESGWSWMNTALVGGVLLMPASTLLPIAWVDWMLAGANARWVLVALLGATYVVIVHDTLWLLRYYSRFPVRSRARLAK